MKKNDKPFLHTKICRSVLFWYVGHIKLCRSVFYNWFFLAEFSQQVSLPTTTAAAAKIHSVSDCCQGVNFYYIYIRAFSVAFPSGTLTCELNFELHERTT